MKLFRDMTDAEMGLLLLADHRGEDIQALAVDHDGTSWVPKQSGKFHDHVAYRVKPKAPKVETHVHECQVWRNGGGGTRVMYQHDDADDKISNITHTYTITDGRVTACDTIIHDGGKP